MGCKTIWHVGAWGLNYGDRILQVANSDILREHVRSPIKFVYIDTQKTYFSEQLINKMNNEADLLLIGGGGLIFNRPMDNSHSKWQFNIDTKNIDKIKIPVVVYGVGYNRFPYDKHEFSEDMWDNLNNVIQKSSLFSVRNEGTFDIVSQNCHVEPDRISIVPDAGMFIKSSKFSHPALHHNFHKIGLNWATDRENHRFLDSRSSTIAMTKTLEMCDEIAEKYNAKVYIIEHLMPNDLCNETKKKLRVLATSILKDRAVFIYDSMFEELYPPFDYTAGFFADIYRQMDLVFGMRGHANIIPFGQNTPFIGIGAHSKVKWFLDEVGMSRHFISLNDDNDFYRAIDLANDIIRNSNKYKEQMAVVHKSMSRTKDIFMKQVARLL